MDPLQVVALEGFVSPKGDGERKMAQFGADTLHAFTSHLMNRMNSTIHHILHNDTTATQNMTAS